jgi:hypothetical protein
MSLVTWYCEISWSESARRPSLGLLIGPIETLEPRSHEPFGPLQLPMRATVELPSTTSGVIPFCQQPRIRFADRLRAVEVRQVLDLEPLHGHGLPARNMWPSARHREKLFLNTLAKTEIDQ